MNLYIVGAGGHGKQCAEIAELLGHKVVFLDDRKSGTFKNVEKWQIVGKVSSIEELPKGSQFFIAIGSNKIRQQICKLVLKHGGELVTLKHPSAVISESVSIAKGVLIAQRAVINGFSEIEQGAIVNTGAIVEHECKVGCCAHISPASVMLGASEVSDLAWLGANSVLFPNVSVAKNTIIGANSLVNRNTNQNTIYIGNPARELVR